MLLTLELRQYKNDSRLKKILYFEFAALFRLATCWEKTRGKFKTKKFSQSIESFLHCLSSRRLANKEGRRYWGDLYIPNRHLIKLSTFLLGCHQQCVEDPRCQWYTYGEGSCSRFKSCDQLDIGKAAWEQGRFQTQRRDCKPRKIFLAREARSTNHFFSPTSRDDVLTPWVIEISS